MSNLTLKEQLSALALGSPTPPASTAEIQKKPRQVNTVTKQKPAWLEHAQYGVELLKAHFPTAFKEIHSIQPLKIGIKQDLVIRLGSLDNIVLNDKACMVNSLSYYVGSVFYLKKMVAGAMRIDLDGNPSTAVTAEEAQYSVDCLQAKQQKRAKPPRKKQEAKTT